MHEQFYVDTISGLRETGWLRPEHSVLVIAGGAADRDALVAAGVRSATITNLDERMTDEAYAPFSWGRQDAEHLTYDDGMFDVCLVHQGLHHCRSPHRALVEMYRVARHGIVVFEPHESLLTRLGVRFGLGQRYELAAVSAHDTHWGGVRNTNVPNFVYRWTEREVYKTLAAFDPTGMPRVRFRYDLRLPDEHATRMRRAPAALLARIVLPLVRGVLRLMPSQANAVAIIADKLGAQDLHPWLRAGASGATADVAWFGEHGMIPIPDCHGPA